MLDGVTFTLRFYNFSLQIYHYCMKYLRRIICLNKDEPSINDEISIDEISIYKISIDKISLNEQTKAKSVASVETQTEPDENEPTINEQSVTESSVNEAITIAEPEVHFKNFFFSEKSDLCKSHLNTLKDCGKPECSVGCLGNIVNAIQSATSSVTICIFNFTLNILRNAITEARLRGVTVKIIVHLADDIQEQTKTEGFFEDMLRATGMKSKNAFVRRLMHNKFAIIDSNFLVIGSANWTWPGFFGNEENLMFINDQNMIKTFQDKFGEMWTSFGGGSHEESLLIYTRTAMAAQTPYYGNFQWMYYVPFNQRGRNQRGRGISNYRGRASTNYRANQIQARNESI